MNSVETVSHPRFPAIGEDSLAAVQQVVRAALAEHGRAGRSVVVWRDGKAVRVAVDENGDEIVGDA